MLDEIDAVRAAIDRLVEQADAVLAEWRGLQDAIGTQHVDAELFSRFYDSVGVSDQQWPLELLQQAFSLFGFLVAFRVTFRTLLQEQQAGPIRDACLNVMLGNWTSIW